MHSTINGSEFECVTAVNITNPDVSVTGIEVDPIHGYVDKHYYIICDLGVIQIFVLECAGT